VLSKHDAEPLVSNPGDSTYQTKATLESAASAGLKGAGVGLLVSTVQNALDTHNRGAAGVITRTGGTIGFFAGMGAVFAFTDAYTANARQVDDPLNGAVGGCAAGFLAGIRARSIPVAVGTCAILGAAVGTLDTAGGKLSGDGRDLDSKETREKRRQAFFKQQTPVQPVTSS